MDIRALIGAIYDPSGMRQFQKDLERTGGMAKAHNKLVSQGFKSSGQTMKTSFKKSGKRIYQLNRTYQKAGKQMNVTSKAIVDKSGNVKSSFTNVAKTGEHMSGSMKKSSAMMGQLAKAMKRVLIVVPIWTAMRSAMQAVTQTLSQGMSYWVEFSGKLVKAEQVIHGFAGTLEEASNNIRKEAEKMSSETGQSLADMAQAYYRFGTVGLNFEDSMAGMTLASKTAIAMFGDQDAIAKVLAQTYRLLGNSMDNALSPMQKMQKISGMLYGLWQKNAFTIDEMTQALQKFLPVANTFNMSMDETLGLLASLQTAGLKGSRAGRLLRTSITKLVANLDQAGKQLGVYVNPQIHGTFDALMKVLGAVDDLTKGGLEKMPKAVTEAMGIFGGVRSRQAGQALTALYDTLQDNLDLVQKGDWGALWEKFQEGYDEARDSLEHQTKRLKNLRKELGKTFLQGLLGGEDFTETMKRLNDIMEEQQATATFWGKTLSTLWRVTPFSEISRDLDHAQVNQRELNEATKEYQRLAGKTEDLTQLKGNILESRKAMKDFIDKISEGSGSLSQMKTNLALNIPFIFDSTANANKFVKALEKAGINAEGTVKIFKEILAVTEEDANMIKKIAEEMDIGVEEATKLYKKANKELDANAKILDYKKKILEIQKEQSKVSKEMSPALKNWVEELKRGYQASVKTIQGIDEAKIAQEKWVRKAKQMISTYIKDISKERNEYWAKSHPEENWTPQMKEVYQISKEEFKKAMNTDPPKFDIKGLEKEAFSNIRTVIRAVTGELKLSDDELNNIFQSTKRWFSSEKELQDLIEDRIDIREDELDIITEHEDLTRELSNLEKIWQETGMGSLDIERKRLSYMERNADLAKVVAGIDVAEAFTPKELEKQREQVALQKTLRDITLQRMEAKQAMSHIEMVLNLRGFQAGTKEFEIRYLRAINRIENRWGVTLMTVEKKQRRVARMTETQYLKAFQTVQEGLLGQWNNITSSIAESKREQIKMNLLMEKMLKGHISQESKIKSIVQLYGQQLQKQKGSLDTQQDWIKAGRDMRDLVEAVAGEDWDVAFNIAGAKGLQRFLTQIEGLKGSAMKIDISKGTLGGIRSKLSDIKTNIIPTVTRRRIKELKNRIESIQPKINVQFDLPKGLGALIKTQPLTGVNIYPTGGTKQEVSQKYNIQAPVDISLSVKPDATNLVNKIVNNIEREIKRKGSSLRQAVSNISSIEAKHTFDTR